MINVLLQMTAKIIPHKYFCYNPEFLDRQVRANSVDPDQTEEAACRQKEQSDQGLHCLPFFLHLLVALLYGETILLKF